MYPTISRKLSNWDLDTTGQTGQTRVDSDFGSITCNQSRWNSDITIDKLELTQILLYQKTIEQKTCYSK